MKKITKAIILMSMIIMIGGCNSNNKENTNNNDSNINSKMDINKIDWKVRQGIVDGKRYALIDYTNNTSFTITHFELSFKEKDSLKEEDKDKYYKDLKDSLYADDNDIKELKKEKISFRMESDKVIKNKETAKNQRVYYYSGIFYLKDSTYIKLTEPDTATIEYIDNNEIHTVYYDYQSKEYTEEESTESSKYWTRGIFKDKLPKPKSSIIIKDDLDDDEEFCFNAYDLTLDDYYNYIDECKNMGYTIDTDSDDTYYDAKNSEGYEIDVEYDEDDHKLSVSIYSPDTDDDEEDESDIDIDDDDDELDELEE